MGVPADWMDWIDSFRSPLSLRTWPSSRFASSGMQSRMWHIVFWWAFIIFSFPAEVLFASLRPTPRWVANMPEAVLEMIFLWKYFHYLPTMRFFMFPFDSLSLYRWLSLSVLALETELERTGGWWNLESFHSTREFASEWVLGSLWRFDLKLWFSSLSLSWSCHMKRAHKKRNEQSYIITLENPGSVPSGSPGNRKLVARMNGCSS